MAGIFLSYGRDDANAARVIATALEKAGHSVWWDLHVRGGAQFSKVIEEALKAADAVVVLWSRNSIDSAWVRDEAAAGRDSGRLIPATIDGTEAPLGFRQFQTIDLGDWKRGARSKGYQELAQAVGDLAPAPAPASRPANPSPLAGRQKLLLAVPIAAALAAGAYFLWPSSSAAAPTVVVVPASGGAMAQDLSRDLLAKLGILQASNNSVLQLVEQGTGATPDLIFKVDASAEGGASKATLLLLSGKSRAFLWSGDFQQPSGKAADLKQQLAYSAANVLDCASDAYGPEGQSLDAQTRQTYLRACGDFSQVATNDLHRITAAFREVTRRAPNFESGWERLLYSEDELILSPPFDQETPAAIASVTADIAAARKHNPDMAAAYIVEADLARSNGSFIYAIRLLDRAVEKNPEDPDALVAASLALCNVGRMKEAVTLARRAVQIRPFSPRAQEELVSALGYSGQLDAAQQELARSEALFPGSSILNDARFRLDLRYGSAEAAIKQLQSGRVEYFPELESMLKARIDPSPANIESALEISRRAIDDTSGGTVANYLQMLAQFGRKDELFDYLLNWRDMKHLGFLGVMFRPPFHDFWRDPRSMRVAAKFGLVGYWKSTGKWPDFCSWQDLPYDCAKEAAKLNA